LVSGDRLERFIVTGAGFQLRRAWEEEVSEIRQGSIEERVKKEVAFHAGQTAESIRSEDSFLADLEFDSLDAVECLMSIEDEFGMEIPDGDAEKIVTVQDAIDYVTANVKA
jgi:acyl carrier protein